MPDPVFQPPLAPCSAPPRIVDIEDDMLGIAQAGGVPMPDGSHSPLLLAGSSRHGARSPCDFIDFVDPGFGADVRRRPQRCFAADGVHPSGFAYSRCDEVLKVRPGVAALVRRVAAAPVAG